MNTLNPGLIILSMCGLICLAVSCKPENPEPDESELITTVRMTFKDSTGAAPDTSFLFRDPDGEGGNAPVQFDSIRLENNKTYYTSIALIDESKAPAVDITAEVREEANDHLFIFKPQGITIDIIYEDRDNNTPALPVGLETKWRTSSSGKGAVMIILKHQKGVKNGMEALGDTDIALNFGVAVD